VNFWQPGGKSQFKSLEPGEPFLFKIHKPYERNIAGTYLWLKDFDFLVLMKKYRDGSRRLITSYFIDYPHKRRKLEKKYNKRIV